MELEKGLVSIYGAEDAEKEKERYELYLEKFEKTFGKRDVSFFSAPGRSELGGNHTDHQHGKILAASINLDAIAVAAPTDEDKIVIQSEGFPRDEIFLDDLTPHEDEIGTSKGIIRGMAANLFKMGYEIGGFYAYTHSNVLKGSGMSSSAAFEVLVGTIISGLYNDMKIDPVQVAIAAKLAENEYFGKPCGLMDQLACSIGSLINVDFENPDCPRIKPLKLDLKSSGYSLCIVDTKGSHADLTEDYATVPAEMKAVARALGKKYLREVDERKFYERISEVRKKAGDRAVLRAIHFFEEEKRVDREAAAIEDGDLQEFFNQVNRSGRSSFQYLQNVYSPSHPEAQGLSLGVALSDVILGDRGAFRIHGGGFAGTIQAYVPDDLVDIYRDSLEALFGEGSCHILTIREKGGTKVC